MNSQSPYVVARAGFEPATIRTKCAESTIEPPRPLLLLLLHNFPFSRAYYQYHNFDVLALLSIIGSLGLLQNDPSCACRRCIKGYICCLHCTYFCYYYCFFRYNLYSDNISTRHAIAASSKINMITFNMTVIELQYSTIDLNDVYRNADSGTDLVAVSVPLSGFTTQLVLLAGYSDLLSSSRLIIDRLELFLADDFGWYNYQSVLNYQTS